MADGRKEGAKKGWETRRARLRVKKGFDLMMAQNANNTTPSRTREEWLKWQTALEPAETIQTETHKPQGLWANFIRWLLRSG